MGDFFLVVPSLVLADDPAAQRADGDISISASADDGYGKNLPNKRIRGTWSEIRFALDGLEHDLIIGKPYTDEVFDVFAMPRVQPVITSSRKRMKIFTVQIRSSHSCGPRKFKQDWFGVPLTHGFEKKPYKRGDFDFLAAYIGPYKTWYIIPVEDIEGRQGIQLCPSDPETTSKWEKFRERWDLLGGK
jgi:hypothetical protein